jgi:hypothetical protein
LRCLSSQIRPFDRFAALEFVTNALLYDLADVKHVASVGHPERKGHILLHQNNTDAEAVYVPYHRSQLVNE